MQVSYNHILAIKLKSSKQDLKVWKKKVFGNVSTKTLDALA